MHPRPNGRLAVPRGGKWPGDLDELAGQRVERVSVLLPVAQGQLETLGFQHGAAAVVLADGDDPRL